MSRAGQLQSIFALARHAQPLDAWARATTVEPSVHRARGKLAGHRPSAKDAKDAMRRLQATKESHAAIDSFFKERGFPDLPPGSKAVQRWEKALRELENVANGATPAKRNVKKRVKDAKSDVSRDSGTSAENAS